jgi:hypothetical protein
MTPTYVIVLNSQRCIRFPNQGGDIRIAGEDSKARGARIQKKSARERGTLQRRKFGLRRYRPALVIFVRVRLVGTWQERFNSLLEHIMPQHNNTAPTWQTAWCAHLRTARPHPPRERPPPSRIACVYRQTLATLSGRRNDPGILSKVAGSLHYTFWSAFSVREHGIFLLSGKGYYENPPESERAKPKRQRPAGSAGRLSRQQLQWPGWISNGRVTNRA